MILNLPILFIYWFVSWLLQLMLDLFIYLFIQSYLLPTFVNLLITWAREGAMMVYVVGHRYSIHPPLEYAEVAFNLTQMVLRGICSEARLVTLICISFNLSYATDGENKRQWQ